MKMKKLLSMLLVVALVVSIINYSSSKSVEGASVTRYTVLILDTSGSMSGTPMDKQQQAAKKFCKDILNAKGTNYVALVELNTSAYRLEEFTNNLNDLEAEIDNLYASGGTNIDAALRKADTMLSEVKTASGVIKNVVLCTDGLPESGYYSYEGPYNYDDYYDYEYANEAYYTAQGMKKKYNIYSLGFFHSLYSDEISFARRFMKDLQNAGYYEVDDPDKLQFTFGDIASDIKDGANNPIIIVPGVMGSHLYDSSSGYRIWDPDTSKITKALALGSKIRYGNNLTLKNNLVNLNQVAKGKREYGAADTYKKLVDKICDTFPNREVYFFSYDFRNDNRVSAERLKEEINSVIASKFQQVDLVCHSMGGLVASHYVAKNGTSKIGRIITLGTPYEGAPKLVNCVLTSKVLDEGYQNLFLSIAGLNRNVKSEFPALAQLAGTKTYYAVKPCYEFKTKLIGSSQKEINYSEYKAKMKLIFDGNYDWAESFHSGIKDSKGFNKLLNYGESYFVVGINQPTVSQIVFNDGKTKNKLQCVDLKYENTGDGTVPFESSTMNKKLTKKKDNQHLARISDTHGGICNNGDSLRWVMNVLARNKNYVYNEKLSKSQYTVVRIACPVDVKITKGKEELNSSNTSKTDTSFGTIDFVGAKSDIKMLCVKGSNYKLSLKGTAKGKMNLTVRNYDGKGKKQREIVYKNVKVNSKTKMYTRTTKKNTKLLVDYNGDGKYEKKYKAKVLVNKKAKKTKIKSIKRTKKGLVVSWKKVKSVKGYKVQCSTSKKFKNNTRQKIVKGKTSVIIKHLKKGKKYYFRVKAYTIKKKKKKYYSWSKTKKKKY